SVTRAGISPQNPPGQATIAMRTLATTLVATRVCRPHRRIGAKMAHLPLQAPPGQTPAGTRTMTSLADQTAIDARESRGPAAYDATQKPKSQAKTARIPDKIVPAEKLKKPEWIRVRAPAPGSRFYEIKRILREHSLHTVCEE